MSFVLSHSMKVQWMSWTLLQRGDWAQMLRPVLPGHHLRAVWCSHVSWAAIVTGDCWFIDNSFIQGLLIHSQFNFRDPLKINTSSRWTLGVTWCASLTWVIGHLDSGWTAQQRGIGQLSGFFCSTVFSVWLGFGYYRDKEQESMIQHSLVWCLVFCHCSYQAWLAFYIYIYLCLLNDNWSEAAGVEVAVSLESMSWSFWGQDAEVMMNFLTLECSWSLGVDMGCGVQKCVQWHILESSGSNLFCRICP